MSETEIKHLDMLTLQHLAEQPGGRNVRRNIAHELIDEYPDPPEHENQQEQINRFASKISHRIRRGLVERGFAQQVGPSKNSGLYEVTDDGYRAAQILDQWDLDNPRDRVQARFDIDHYLA